MERIANEAGKSISQVALNWLLHNETVSNIVVGARNEQQLIENIEAVGWSLSETHFAELNTITAQTPVYTNWVGER